jgi:hypothetical protein
MLSRIPSALLAFLPSAALSATLRVGTAAGYAAPSLAIAAARDGDTVLIEAGHYDDCAIVRAGNVTIEGAGPAAGVVLDGKPCQGKALLVITGRNVTVRNLTLAGARVPDGNGAGIRAEGENLTVDGVRFIGNEDGILGASPAPSTMLVENSLFERNGSCVAACAHGIYANRIALLRVVHCRFDGTLEGHDIKSRAARTEIVDNDIADGPDGTSSYLIEAPNGGALLVDGNRLEKGPRTSNRSAAIVIGAEGVNQPTPEITVTNNDLANDSGERTALVYNLSGTKARLMGNRATGPVEMLRGNGEVRR